MMSMFGLKNKVLHHKFPNLKLASLRMSQDIDSLFQCTLYQYCSLLGTASGLADLI